MIDLRLQDASTLKRWTILSWLSPVVAIALVGFLLTSSIGQTQTSAQAPTFTDNKVKSLMGGRATANNRSTAQMICTVSSFFSIDSNEQVNGTIHIEGRGLASCKNDQGFTTEVPVFADLEAKAVGNWANAGELSFSANSSSFIIPREIGQIQDRYTVKTFASDLADKTNPTVLFQGAQHDLVIDMKLSSATDAFQKIEMTGLTLRFDENAPTLE